jgi:hypothetical protein
LCSRWSAHLPREQPMAPANPRRAPIGGRRGSRAPKRRRASALAWPRTASASSSRRFAGTPHKFRDRLNVAGHGSVVRIRHPEPHDRANRFAHAKHHRDPSRANDSLAGASVCRSAREPEAAWNDGSFEPSEFFANQALSVLASGRRRVLRGDEQRWQSRILSGRVQNGA